MTREGCYSLKSMKWIAHVLVLFNFLLLIIWTIGAIYLLAQLSVAACYQEEWTQHFLILIHFALAFYLTTIISDINREERRYDRASLVLTRLPYSFYQPLAWFFVSVSSLVGDALLLASGVHFYWLGVNDNDCQETRIAHIAYNAIATIISLFSLLWFVIFSTYNIRHPQKTNRKSV